MPTNRIIPTLGVAFVVPLLAWAQAPDAKKAEPAPNEVEKILDEAIAKVKGLKAVTADVAQTVEMLGQNFTLKGKYMKAPANRVYMLLSLNGLADASGTMLQVCDGAILWDYSKILDAQSCRKLEIKPVLEKLNSPGCDPTIREQVLGRMNFAGPETLLVGLKKAIAFNAKDEGELDGRPVWIISGSWKDRDSLKGQGGQPGQPGQDTLAVNGPLPPYVPSIARVWIGKEDGWPYQVLLEGRALSIMERKKEERVLGPDGRPTGRPIAAPNEKPSKILLVYSAVKLNPEVNPGLFAFEPPQNVRVEDGTQQIVTDLENALNEMAAMKKAEAAKVEGDLPASIAVPKPDADASANPASAPK